MVPLKFFTVSWGSLFCAADLNGAVKNKINKNKKVRMTDDREIKKIYSTANITPCQLLPYNKVPGGNESFPWRPPV